MVIRMVRQSFILAIAVLATQVLSSARAAQRPATQPATSATTQASDDYDAYMTDYIAWMDEVTKALKPVTTADDAKAAIPRLRELAEVSMRLRKRADALPAPSGSRKKAFTEKFGRRIETSLNSSSKETERVFEDAVLGPILHDEIERLMGRKPTTQPSGGG